MRVGLIVNPVAGLGGKVALKGSDGQAIQDQAMRMGAKKEASLKTLLVLEKLLEFRNSVTFYTVAGEMGEAITRSLGFESIVLYVPDSEQTDSRDTKMAAQKMLSIPVDLLIFTGGDGTARDIFSVVKDRVPVFGIPGGVKIHSGVYANSLTDASRGLRQCFQHPIHTEEASVMDIDEELFREGVVSAKRYGTLHVPRLTRIMQNPKAASYQSEDDVMGVFHEVSDRLSRLPADTQIVWGTGGTIYHVMMHLGLEGSLLGVDVSCCGELVMKDVTESQLRDILIDKDTILITGVIGGQGHIFGRGNVQLSPQVLRLIGPENMWIVATIEKIRHLTKHQLRVDTPDFEFNESITGYRPIIVGWQRELICEIVT